MGKATEWRRRWRLNCSMAFILSCLFVYLVARNQKNFSERESVDACLPKLRYSIPAPAENGTTDYRIPRIIHMTWGDPEAVPFIYRPWMESWIKHNPGWEIWFWSDSDINKFIHTCYPHFAETFNSYPTTGYKVDAFRYFVIYEFGGIYADIDTESLRPLNELARIESCIVGQEPLEHAHFLGPMGIPLVSNAVMACVPHHKFFRVVVDHLGRHTGYFTWNDILYATGPYMLTYEFHNYGAGNSENPLKHISLAHPELFMPTIDESMVDMIKDTCFKGHMDFFMWPADVQHRKDLCNRLMSNRFTNSPTDKSLLNHHWTHTWASAQHDPWGVKNMRRFFSVEDLWYS